MITPIRNPAAPSRHTSLLGPLAVVVLAVILLPLLWKPWIHGNDGVRNYAYCRSFWIDHDLDFSNEFDHYRRAGEMAPATQLGAPDPATGKPGNALGVGSSILWSPFFLLGHLVARVFGSATDGYSRPYVWAVCFGSTFYAILGLFLLARIATRHFSSFAGTAATIAMWFGSPLLFYMYLHPSMSHACSFFLCVLLLWEYDRWRDEPRIPHFLLMGITAGLIVTTRFSDGAFLLIPAAFWLESLLSQRSSFGAPPSRMLFAPIVLATGVLIAMTPQLYAWHVLHGSWFSGPSEYGLEKHLSPIWTSPHFFSLLFSGWRGLFVWSPVLLLGSVGVALLLRERRLIDYALVLVALIQLWVIGGWAMWWGGASFGQRFFIDLLPLFAFGLAYLFHLANTPRIRISFVCIVLLSLLWSGGLMVQYVSGMISREEPVTLREIAANQWQRVPAWLWNHARLLLPGAHRGVQR